MKTLILSTLLFSLFTGFSFGDNRLLGTWKSNKERSLAYMKQSQKFDAEKLAVIESVLSDMTVRYDNNYASYDIIGRDDSGTARYRIIAENKKFTLIEFTDVEDGEIQKLKLNFFTPDEYWIFEEKLPGYGECFTRVEEDRARE